MGGDQPRLGWIEKFRAALGAFIGLMLVLTTAKFLGEISGLGKCLATTIIGANKRSLSGVNTLMFRE